MNKEDYGKAKQECWDTLYKEHLKDEVQWQPVSRKEIFNLTFNRAYRLGMEAAKKEMLTANVDSSQPNVESLEETPAEPKFEIGTKVKWRNNTYRIAEIGRSYEEGYYYIIKSVLTGQGFQAFESDITPYTKPQADKHFDNILKDSFRNERRLNIATQILCAIIPKFENGDIGLTISDEQDIMQVACRLANMLIAESDKNEYNDTDSD